MSILSVIQQFADGAPKINSGDVNIPNTSANNIFTDGINVVLFIAGVMAVIVIILAGFRYVTSGGDSGAIVKAKNQILWGIVGLVVVSIAFVIVDFVIGRFQ